MKIKTLAAVGAAVALSAVFTPASPLGTAFTYQGNLTVGTNAANGHYDFRWAIYDAATNGNRVGSVRTNAATPVANGYFDIWLSPDDWAFQGEDRWLEIAMCTNGAGDFVTLTPRQQITPTPYALYAPSAGMASASSNLLATLAGNLLSGTYSNAFQLTNAGNSFSGNGAGLTNLNASNLASGTVSEARLSPNMALFNSSPTFSGTVSAGGDLVGARLKVGVNHTLAAPYATIAGGQGNTIQFMSLLPTNAVISGGESNLIQGRWATIAGGMGNTIADGAEHSSIGGGALNSILYEADQAVIGGGGYNTIGVNNNSATISGGANNTIQQDGLFATISGGQSNVVGTSAQNAMIPGGLYNTAAGAYSFASGRRARANHQGAFVWAGSTDADIASTNANSVTMRASGGYRLFANSGATAGVYLAPGGGTWTSMSDRNAK